MKMRQFICLVSCAICLAGCGEAPQEPTEATAEQIETAVVNTEVANTEDSSQSATDTVSDVDPETESPSVVMNRIGGPIFLDDWNDLELENVYGVMRDITAAELIGEITVGWNLGNTFDARGGETAWGNPRVTPELIQDIADKGFDCIRIPVTWFQYTEDGPDYTIHEKWLNRVEQVVAYALEQDMYVIINTHHETDWLVPDLVHLEASKEAFVAMWKQIAEYFEPYGDHLLFEGMNEPRVEGSPNEWGGGTIEGRVAVNLLNQAFVETVRATGGNNANRCLLLTSYAAASTSVALENLTIPEDEHIAFSIHAYVPYEFTFDPVNGYAEWVSEEHPDAIRPLFERLDQYLLSLGVPVIITEFGAVTKTLESGETNDAEVVKWLEDYMGYASEYGVPCVWWDNGQCTSGNELFAIYDRENKTWFRGSVADAMIKGAGGAQ